MSRPGLDEFRGCTEEKKSDTIKVAMNAGIPLSCFNPAEKRLPENKAVAAQ
jgi:hypothetical protein